MWDFLVSLVTAFIVNGSVQVQDFNVAKVGSLSTQQMSCQFPIKTRTAGNEPLLTAILWCRILFGILGQISKSPAVGFPGFYNNKLDRSGFRVCLTMPSGPPSRGVQSLQLRHPIAYFGCNFSDLSILLQKGPEMLASNVHRHPVNRYSSISGTYIFPLRNATCQFCRRWPYSPVLRHTLRDSF